MSSEPLRESETVELKKSLVELKEGLVSIAAIPDEDRQLSAAELEAIIVDKNQNALRWDTRALDKPWPDLEIKKVKIFAKRAGLQWDTLGDDDEIRLQQALTKLELLQKGELFNAARLFFAKEPIQLRCAVFGVTDSFARPSFSLNDQETTGTTENTKKTPKKPLENNVQAPEKNY